MRNVRFKDIPALGRDPGDWSHESLEQFVVRLSPIRYLLIISRKLPSLEKLNRELQKGRCDEGMSGAVEWKPFTIAEEEYSGLCEALFTNPKFRLKT